MGITCSRTEDKHRRRTLWLEIGLIYLGTAFHGISPLPGPSIGISVIGDMIMGIVKVIVYWTDRTNSNSNKKTLSRLLSWSPGYLFQVDRTGNPRGR